MVAISYEELINRHANRGTPGPAHFSFVRHSGVWDYSRRQAFGARTYTLAKNALARWGVPSRIVLHPASRKYDAISACRRKALAGRSNVSIIEAETSQWGTTLTS